MEPEVGGNDQRFIIMSTYLLDGLWAMNPFLELNSFLFYLRTMFKNNLSSIDEKNVEYRRLSMGAKFRVHFLVFLTSLMRFRLVRELMGYVKRHSLWLMKHFPYLAYYKFGKKHAHVDILTSYQLIIIKYKRDQIIFNIQNFKVRLEHSLFDQKLASTDIDKVNKFLDQQAHAIEVVKMTQQSSCLLRARS